MLQRLRRLDPTLLAVLALAALALLPFLSRSALPRFTDAELHVYRLAELARLVAQGELYPRWAPNFYFGYGYPIFNYYAPLSYYAGLPVALMPWWDAVDGVRAVLILGLLVGALGTYAFTRAHWGRSAGLVSAAAYSFAPYVLYVDPHARGDLAETFGMSLFPLSLWAIDRLRRGSAGSWLLAVGAVAAVILSHNLLALVSFALLLAWSLWQCAGAEEPRAVCALRLAALGAGVGVAAFFWLPVALEQNAVNLSTLIGDGGHFDFRNHFLTLAQLLGPAGRLDWGATEAAFRFHLGLPQWLLALAGVALILANRVRARRRALFFALAAALLIGLMLPLAEPLWNAVPLLPYFQFPWRLLATAAPVLAILAGVAAGALARRARAARWLPALLVGLLIVAAFPLLQVPPWPADTWDTSVAGVLAEETRGRWLGTTSTADFVPAMVDVIPQPTGQVVAALRAGEQPDRVNRATLPATASVAAETIRPLHTRYLVSSAEPFPLRLYQFAFPGWQARVDGSIVATEVGRPEGFLVVPIPAGEHAVDVELVATPAQRIAWLVSALALMLAGGVALWLRRRPPQPGAAQEEDVSPGKIAGPVLLAVAIAALLYALLSSAGWLHVHSTGWQAIPADRDLFASLDGEIALIGFDAPVAARPGQTFTITLYWKAQEPVSENYQVFVHLLWPDGTIAAQSDKLNPGEFPTRRWPLDRYVRDQHRLSLPANLPPGDYALSAGLWLQGQGNRLPVVDGSGELVGDAVMLGVVTVDQ